MKLSEEEAKLIEKIWLEKRFHRNDFSRLFLEIFRSCGLQRNISYEVLEKAFYLENFQNNKNLIYAAISATLYSFSILSTLFIMGGASEEEQQNFSRKIANKIAEKISRKLNDGHKNEMLEIFLVESFHLSLLAQMDDDENNKISLEAMFHLYDFQCVEDLLDGDKSRLKRSGAVNIQKRKETPIFQSLANILKPIFKKNKIMFNRKLASNTFNNFMGGNLHYPFNPASLLCQKVIINYGTPLIFFTLTTLYWRNYVSLPYTVLAAVFLGWGFKYIKRSIAKSFYASLKEGRANQISMFAASIEKRQDFLVAEYEQEENQTFQPPLLFTPMITEEFEEKMPTLWEYAETAFNLYAQGKPKKVKSYQGKNQEKNSIKAELKKDNSTLPEGYYPTNYKNQILRVNPSEVKSSKGKDLNEDDIKNIRDITDTARLCIYPIPNSNYVKVKRGRYDRTAPRLFAKRTKETIEVAGRRCRIYKATVYSLKH